MSDRPLSVHVRAASLVWKKLKLAGLDTYGKHGGEAEKENANRSMLCKSDLSAMRDLEKYLKLVGSVIPNHPSYRRRKDDADIVELEVRQRCQARTFSLAPASDPLDSFLTRPSFPASPLLPGSDERGSPARKAPVVEEPRQNQRERHRLVPSV